ncbi:YbaB/EbfC family nucleoid-associated protein [Nocardia callitridis]|uniref:YbaB/EbfC family DNA-binding protein n=1 Tax=Nocardia callitridis TaxID=648753 RepID=A0ABP9KXJ8_9NOCA
MANEVAKAQLADLMAAVQAGMASIARMQQEQSELTVAASSAGRRVTVVVNGDGIVIETRFGAGIEDLTHAQIAKAVTEAAQDAQGQVRRKTREMVDSLHQQNARLPRLSEFLPGMPDVQDMLPRPPEASLAPPSRRQHAVISDGTRPAMSFVDVEEWDHDRHAERRSDVAESGW